jgi:hypothetical protein
MNTYTHGAVKIDGAASWAVTICTFMLVSLLFYGVGDYFGGIFGGTPVLSVVAKNTTTTVPTAHDRAVTNVEAAMKVLKRAKEEELAARIAEAALATAIRNSAPAPAATPAAKKPAAKTAAKTAKTGS